jgi:hypothetical protein
MESGFRFDEPFFIGVGGSQKCNAGVMFLRKEGKLSRRKLDTQIRSYGTTYGTDLDITPLQCGSDSTWYIATQ